MVDTRHARRHKTALTVAAVLLLAALGFSALAHLLREVHLHDIRHAWAQIGAPRFAAAGVLTIVSYLALTLYDVLALRTIGQPLPYRTAALASFTSYTLSHNLGLALLTGGSARYRIYSAQGLSAGDVARIMAIASLTFWGGVLVLAGAMLALSPDQIALAGFAPAPWMWRTVGVLLLAGIGGILLWAGRDGRSLRLARWHLKVPGYRLALTQILVASIDLAAASAALLILVPGTGMADWPAFFMGYTLAIIVVLITHVPGGVGVFEAIMIAALPAAPRPELIAALLGYRLVYYLIPLLIAAIIVAGQEGQRWRRPVRATLRGAQVVASGIAPIMVGALVFLGGMVLLISGSLPAKRGRLDILSDIVPLPFVEASHMGASLVGAALLLLSAGLYRRLDGAVWLTRVLLVAGAAFSLLKGLDYEEATIMLIVAAILQWTKSAFYRRTRLTQEVLTPGWLAMVAMMIGLPIWLGFFAFKKTTYRNDLWWHFSEHGDASRFLRASVTVAILLIGLAAWRMMRPVPPSPGARSSLEPPEGEAMALTKRTDANLAFTGDKRFLRSASGRAFLMYQIRGHSWIVMGDPVGDPAEWNDLLWTLREEADAAQGRLILYQISVAALPIAIDLGLQIVKYGEEARVDLASFTMDGPASKSLRHVLRRAERDGARFEIVPAAEVPAILDRLREISDQWLSEKGSREKGFSVGRFDPIYMSRFDCAVVRQGERIVAFANIWTTADHSELSIDLMRHDHQMPYGTMDFLFLKLIQWGQAQGYRWFTLGLAPLSGLEARRLAPLWVRLGSLLYHHGEALYGFEGLRSYKDKFSPDWEPRFIAGPQGLALGRALIDLQALIAARP
ncbi:MAG TPA: bifunctional lysylphosphatidylglycerol flippase/synthetase MprF [Sphingobium sp.]|uniref:bifunctional lysylphosphatidylglycerol flippase/synthetase MprF n=1 Tax=Sphingobium sp. TaxID=1912891 RepID=UPI002ED4F40C